MWVSLDELIHNASGIMMSYNRASTGDAKSSLGGVDGDEDDGSTSATLSPELVRVRTTDFPTGTFQMRSIYSYINSNKPLCFQVPF